MKRLLRKAWLPAYLTSCLLLGGSSIASAANLLLQLLAIALIFWALATSAPAQASPWGYQLLSLLPLLVLLLAFQLLPLPPAIWTKLPGRDAVAEAYQLIGQPIPWLAISLAPYRTITSCMWLLPPAAIILGWLRLGGCPRIWIAWVLIGATTASVPLGTLQIAAGSGWYPYEITNLGAMTGFFANANHLATLLLATMPFVAALYATARRAPSQNLAAATIAPTVAAIFLLMGIIINGSLAGVGLMVPVAAASALMIRRGARRISGRWWFSLAGAAAGSVAVVFAAPFANDLTQAKPHQITRAAAWPSTLQAAADFAPVGSGLGTFINVYPRYEDPALVDPTYMNHAHNDYLEVALETGLPGLVLLFAFLLWWARRALSIWRAPDPDNVFTRAATIASAAILAHSMVDYPLRTTAISALFALCCALMAAPAQQPARRKSKTFRKGMFLSAE